MTMNHAPQNFRFDTMPPTYRRNFNRRLQFDSDYDIQRANEQFQRTLSQNTVVKSMDELKKDEFFGGKSNVFYYDRYKSFFDNISCETREKLEGQNVRPDWRKERITNQETFGFYYRPPLRRAPAPCNLNLTKNGFLYKVDVSGFQPNEVKVNIQGENIVIKGDHRVTGEHETVERSFVRRLRIPINVQKESMVADFDESGHLVITGKQVAIEQTHVRFIPIHVKGAITGDQQQKQ